MKKTLLALSLAGICLLLAGCSDNSGKSSGDSSNNSTENPTAAETPAEKAEELLNTINFPEMVQVKGTNLEASLGIKEEELEDFAVYRCGSGAYPDEFGIIVVKDSGNVMKVKSAVKDWIDFQSDSYRDYKPAEMYKLEDSFVSVNGKTVTYAICEDNSKAREILG